MGGGRWSAWRTGPGCSQLASSAVPLTPRGWIPAFWWVEWIWEKPLVVREEQRWEEMGPPQSSLPLGSISQSLCGLTVVSSSGFRDIHPSQTAAPSEMTHGHRSVGVGSVDPR